MQMKQELLYQLRTFMIVITMFISGLIFVCYMGISLIKTTKKYQEYTIYMAQNKDDDLVNDN